MMGTTITGERVDAVEPVDAVAIDHMVRAERPDTIELVSSGRDDDLRPVQLGEEQSEQRDASGSQDEHRFAGARASALHQREPRGQAGTRQRARLDEIVRDRCRYQPVLRDGDIFREYAREVPAKGAIGGCLGAAGPRAIDPFGGKAGEDFISIFLAGSICRRPFEPSLIS
jgi:hypothetical protein